MCILTKTESQWLIFAPASGTAWLHHIRLQVSSEPFVGSLWPGDIIFIFAGWVGVFQFKMSEIMWRLYNNWSNQCFYKMKVRLCTDYNAVRHEGSQDSLGAYSLVG